MKRWFATVQASILVLALATGGCETQEAKPSGRHTIEAWLDGLADVLGIFESTGFVMPEKKDYSMQILMMGDMLGYRSKSAVFVKRCRFLAWRGCTRHGWLCCCKISRTL